MSNSSVFDCSIIELKSIKNRAGNITPVQSEIDLNFDIKRLFYLYDIPGGVSRGAHAHKLCKQLIIAASGSFEVYLDDGNIKRTVQLKHPNIGLYVPPYIWAAEINFSSGAICLVLASEDYDPHDYIRDYQTFLKHK